MSRERAAGRAHPRGELPGPNKRFAPCTVEGAQFACPALSAYSTSYTLTFAVGATRLERQVTITAKACTVEATSVAIEMSSLDCPVRHVSSAVYGHIYSPAGLAVPYITGVRARVDGGSFFACEGSFYSYSCPIGRSPGGGHYEIEVMAGGETYTGSADVFDDGCR